MRELILNKKTTVQFYESIKEWPILNKHELGKLVVQDIGVGDSMTSVAQHFITWHNYMKLGKHAEAAQEGINLHNNFFYMIEGISIDSYSFTTYVKSINGVSHTDRTTGGADKIIKQLAEAGLTVGHVEDLLEELKKKLIRNFDPSFLIVTEEVAPYQT